MAALGNIPLAEDGREILVRAGGYPGLAEVFLVSGDQLERYVALNAVGLPVTFNDLIFAETRFRYEAQVSVTITETEFRRVGCSGPFPLYAPVEQAEAVIPLTTNSSVFYAPIQNYEVVFIFGVPAVVTNTHTLQIRPAGQLDSINRTYYLTVSIGHINNTLTGQVIMAGFLRRRIPLFLRRALTMFPALVVLALGVDPTWALVMSQVVLSFGIPFALVPLLLLTRRPDIMGELVNRRRTTVSAVLVTAVIVLLNAVLLFLLLF